MKKNTSNGEWGTADGGDLLINGRAFKKGLGVHSDSELIFRLDDNAYETFHAWMGVDDEVEDRGSVQFQIYVDGSKLLQY